jgi:DinB family protein
VTPKELLIEEAEASYALVERLLRRVADDELAWKPGEGRGWMTTGQLLMHCACFGCGKAIQGFVEGDWGAPADAGGEVHVPPPAALPSVASVRQALDLLAEDRALALRCLAAADDADLFGRRVAAPWGGGERPLFQQLLHMIAHLVQHKGQLFYYLKLMGKDVSTADLWAV